MVAGAEKLPPRRRLRTKCQPPESPKRHVGAISSEPCASVGGKSATQRLDVEDKICISLGTTQMGAFEVKEVHSEYIVAKTLDDDMLQRLTDVLKRKRPKAAKMKNEGGDSDDERKARYDDRDSLISWIDSGVECPWFHERIKQLVRDVANVQWPLLKVASGEPIWEAEKSQYTVYGPKQHFQAWHKDAYAEGNDMEDARQFAIVVMLSSKDDFTGGEFQAKVVSQPGRRRIKRVAFDAGDAVVFPAKRLPHRVTAVGTGIRKTLVCWARDRASCKFYNSALKNPALKKR